MTRGVLKRPAISIATGFGVGYLWPAPGTMGSILGLAIFLLLLAPLSLSLQLLAWAVLTAVGTAAADLAARSFGGQDPSSVVIDEIAAMWLASAGIASGRGWLLAFLFFRLFDIIKPFPARRLEKWRGGYGIMADDVVAALYAQVGVRLVLALWG